MGENIHKSDLELLYNSAPDLESMNQIYNDLKIVFIEYLKAKFPLISALSVLRHDRLLKKEENRLNKLISDIQYKTGKIDKNKIDYEFVNTEEFARIVFHVYDKAKSDYREEKLKYYSNLLINYTTKDFSQEFYKEGLIEKIARLSGEHFIVLNEFYKKYLNDDLGNRTDKEKNDPIGSVNWRDLRLANIKPNLIELCLVDLQAEGLLYNLASFRFDGAVNEEFSISPYGIKVIQLINSVQ